MGGALPLIADRVDLFRGLFLRSPGEAESPGPSVQEQLAGGWYDIAGKPFPTRSLPGESLGPDRILYGSDYCGRGWASRPSSRPSMVPNSHRITHGAA